MFWLGFAVGVVLGSIAGLLFAAMCAIGRIEELETRACWYESLYLSACRTPVQKDAIVIE